MKLYSVLILLSLSTQASALDYQIEIGQHSGGDRITTGVFTTGYVSTINAGEGFSISGGLVFNYGDKYAARFKYGSKREHIEAVNGSLNWEKNTADALLMYKINSDIQIGGGLTYHTNVELRGTGVADGSDKFDNALGALAEVDYFWDPKSYIGLVFTAIDYEINGFTFSGNSSGIVIGGIF